MKKKTFQEKEIDRLNKEVARLSAHLKVAKTKRMIHEDPDAFDESEEARDLVAQFPIHGLHEMETYFPQDYNKRLPKEGNWIRVNVPPHTEITVPPFSMWFATPWPMERDRNGLAAKRVKIVTPSGEIGIMPHEYCVVEDVTKWIGKEADGVYLRQMNGNPVCDRDSLFYLMSRGISRSSATLLLIGQIKDPTFLWIEVAPPYGEHFGKEWPDPKACPFATPRDQFVVTEEILAHR